MRARRTGTIIWLGSLGGWRQVRTIFFTPVYSLFIGVTLPLDSMVQQSTRFAHCQSHLIMKLLHLAFAQSLSNLATSVRAFSTRTIVRPIAPELLIMRRLSRPPTSVSRVRFQFFF